MGPPNPSREPRPQGTLHCQKKSPAVAGAVKLNCTTVTGPEVQGDVEHRLLFALKVVGDATGTFRLDECPPWPVDRDACALACSRSLRWARRCRELAVEGGFIASGRHVFAIAQGSTYDDLRREAAEALAALDFSGYAIGGVSVGEAEPEMLKQVAATAPHLPSDRPRYVMGVGTPPQLLKMIALGVDMFDCVLPTRVARNGLAFTPGGPINLRNERFRADPAPIVEGLDNYTCRNFSRAYLRHLIAAGEMLGGTLVTIHNLHFFQIGRAHV